MPESVLDTSTNAVYIPTIIAQKTLQRLSAYLSIAKNISKDSDWTTVKQGTVLQIPKTGAVTAKDKVAGEVFTKQDPTGTTTSVTLNKRKEVTFTIDDLAKVVENQDTQARYGEDGAIALAEVVESDILALHPSISATVTWDSASADSIDSSLLNIRKFFTDQKVPRLEPKFMSVNSKLFNDLLKQEKYTNQSWRGNQNTVAEGIMVKTYGFQIEESQLIPTSGSPVAYHNIAYTKNGYVLATRPLPRPEGFGGRYSIVNDPNVGISVRTLFWFNADLGAHQLTIEMLYGVAILDNRRVVEVEST